MEDTVTRILHDLVARTEGPLHFRVILQPLMAAIFAVIAGLKDAKAGHPPYFWTLFTDSTQRRGLLKEGWKQVGKIFVLAVVLDVVYQLWVTGFVYPFEVVLVAFILAIVPYVVLRGIVTRIASRTKGVAA